jgi:hypothetical protein
MMSFQSVEVSRSNKTFTFFEAKNPPGHGIKSPKKFFGSNAIKFDRVGGFLDFSISNFYYQH